MRSGRRWHRWGSTRALRRCWTSSATPDGAGSRSASPRTRTSSGSIGTAYVRGLEQAGIVATLKHFVGYSASSAGRNFAPTHAGPREVADVLLIPFEMAVLDGHVRSVMHSYAEVDGLPAAADRSLLTGILRDRWGFDGVVVSDYFGVAFLASLHGVAADLGDAAAQALDAGVDVELPTGNAYRAPLADAVRAGAVDETLVDRALERVLRQKAELGLLDAKFDGPAPVDPSLDPAEHRAIARRLAEEAVVLLGNHGTLPLSGRRQDRGHRPKRQPEQRPVRVLLVREPRARPTTPTCRSASTCRACWTPSPRSSRAVRSLYAQGCGVDDPDRSGFGPAVAAARDADVAIVVAGDRAGLFGRGTSGEGCDVDTLELPGVQRELVEAVLATGTPVVLVLVTGRPYAVGWALDRCAAVVQAFFPGEEGAAAIAGVISGRVNPSGRLPVSLPRSVGSQPYSYLHPTLGGRSSVSNLDPEPARPFGFGMSYTTFVRSELRVSSPTVATDGWIEVDVRVANTGTRAGADVVQLYGHDPVASITRPVAQLLGYARVQLEPGAAVVVHFAVPTARIAFSGRDLVRAVEPGTLDLWVGGSCAESDVTGSVELVGKRHEISPADPRWVDVVVEPALVVTTR